MQSTDYDQFCELISTWLIGHKLPVDVATLAFWTDALRHLELETIKRAVRAVVTSPEDGTRNPTPALVIKHVPVNRPEYEQLPNIARGSGMAGVLDHLESKQERGSRGRKWLETIRCSLAQIAEGPRKLTAINHDRHVLGLPAMDQAQYQVYRYRAKRKGRSR